jgi:hypothetical protein
MTHLFNEHCHRVHRVAMAASWRTFYHIGKISPAWWGWVRSCFFLQSWFKQYHPCPIISRLIFDKVPKMILRFKFIIVWSSLSQTRYAFSTIMQGFWFFFSFCSTSLCGCASCVPLGYVGIATGKVPSDFQILFAKSPYLSAPYLITYKVTYTVYNTCSPLRDSPRGPNSRRWNQTWGSLAGKRGKTNVQIKDDFGSA